MIKKPITIRQKVSNLFSFVFILYRYRNKSDPFREFQKLKKQSSKGFKIKKNKNLILVPFRVSPMSNLFEGLIGFYYKLKGYKVYAIMCNQSVPYCENITHRDEKKRNEICALCLKEQKRFCSTFNIEPLNIDSFITDQDEQDINSHISSFAKFDEAMLSFRGIKLQKHVYSAVTRYTLRSEIKFDADLELIKGFLRTAALCQIASFRIFNSISCNHLIMSHGIYSTWGTILEAARIKMIPAYVWARGYVGQGNLLFGQNMSYLEDLILEDKKVYQSFIYSAKDLNQADNYFLAKRDKSLSIEYVNYYSNINSNPSSLEKFLTKNPKIRDGKIFGMFTNIPWDGQIFNQTKGFPNTRIYIKSVINWFRKNLDCHLFIRIHPAEVDREEGNGSEKFIDVLFSCFEKLPPNIILIHADSPISSYDLFGLIDAAIVYGSSMGLELAIAGIPVIQAGNFYTSNKNIVLEAKNTQILFEYLDQVKSGDLSMSETEKLNSKKFGYYWIYKRHIPDTSVILKNLIFESFGFNSIEEFENNSTFDLIFNRISENNRILNSK